MLLWSFCSFQWGSQNTQRLFRNLHPKTSQVLHLKFTSSAFSESCHLISETLQPWASSGTGSSPSSVEWTQWLTVFRHTGVWINSITRLGVTQCANGVTASVSPSSLAPAPAPHENVASFADQLHPIVISSHLPTVVPPERPACQRPATCHGASNSPLPVVSPGIVCTPYSQLVMPLV